MKWWKIKIIRSRCADGAMWPSLFEPFLSSTRDSCILIKQWSKVPERHCSDIKILTLLFNSQRRKVFFIPPSLTSAPHQPTGEPYTSSYGIQSKCTPSQARFFLDLDGVISPGCKAPHGVKVGKWSIEWLNSVWNYPWQIRCIQLVQPHVCALFRLFLPDSFGPSWKNLFHQSSTYTEYIITLYLNHLTS